MLLISGALVAQDCQTCGPDTVEITASCSNTDNDTPSFSWSTNETTPSIIVTTSGTYTVTCTMNGCESVESFVIQIDPQPQPTCSSVDATCGASNGEVSVDQTFAGYQWDDPANSTTQTVTGLPAGTYSVTVTDGNGCTNVCSAVVGNSAGPMVSCNVTNGTVCFGDTDGEIAATASAGAPPYTYLWSDNQTTATATNLGAGTYTVTVTDANTCTITCSGTIVELPETNLALSCN